VNTEIAKVSVSLGGQLDLDQMYRLSANLAQSSLLPKDLAGKPSNVLAAMLYGQELGLAPMQAIQSIYVVNGRPTIAAQLWVALTRRAGHKIRVIEETPEACTVEVTRADDPDNPTRVTYTLDQAKAAKLTGKDVWTSHRAAMLYARAVSTACRRACPEIALGFGDEVDRVELAVEDKPTLAQVAAQRLDLIADNPGPVGDTTVDDNADAASVAAQLAELDAGQGLLPDDPDLFDQGSES
jgi:hypothetical protein